MATNTEKLNLKLPAPEDFYNIEDSNENFRKIDKHLENFEASQDGAAAGESASATEGGGAIGNNASATFGGAIGREASTTYGGGSVGYKASSNTGGAVGWSASATNGGAIGREAKSQNGGSVGYNATTTTGGSVGYNASSESGGGSIGESASSTKGGAAGYIAKTTSGGAVGRETQSENGGAVGREAKTIDGGAIGNTAYTGSGGAVGKNATSQDGGAIGDGAVAYNGFSGGANAKAAYSDDTGYPIDTIQLGEGTNDVPRSLGVYEYLLMDSNGKVPTERLPIASGSYVGNGNYGEKNPTIIPVPFKPRLLFIGNALRTSPYIYMEDWFKSEYVYSTAAGTHVKYEDGKIFIYDKSSTNGQYNSSGDTYRWFVLG